MLRGLVSQVQSTVACPFLRYSHGLPIFLVLCLRISCYRRLSRLHKKLDSFLPLLVYMVGCSSTIPAHDAMLNENDTCTWRYFGLYNSCGYWMTDVAVVHANGSSNSNINYNKYYYFVFVKQPSPVIINSIDVLYSIQGCCIEVCCHWRWYHHGLNEVSRCHHYWCWM